MLGWSLSVAAFVMAFVVAVLAAYMLNPVDWPGPGKFSALALAFPLHLLAVAALAVALGLLAWWCGAGLAVALCALVVIGSAAMALVPTFLVWQSAREYGVPLSLREYLQHAAHINIGRPQPERSVVYGTGTDGTELLLDVWRAEPSSNAARPAVVIVHGGAWTHGNRSGAPQWNRWLNQLGYEVFDVEYRMPPPDRWRDEVGDVKCALGWVAAHAANFQIDPARISVMGYSAGGNLALLAAYSMGDPALPPSCPGPAVTVRSVVNVYGPADLRVLHDSGGSVDYVRSALEEYIGGTPGQHAERYRIVSPIGHVSAQAPPTITILGLSDRIVPVEQERVLSSTLEQAAVAHETYLLPATDHGFDVNWGGWSTQIARAKIAQFLRHHDQPG